MHSFSLRKHSLMKSHVLLQAFGLVPEQSVRRLRLIQKKLRARPTLAEQDSHNPRRARLPQDRLEQ